MYIILEETRIVYLVVMLPLFLSWMQNNLKILSLPPMFSLPTYYSHCHGYHLSWNSHGIQNDHTIWYLFIFLTLSLTSSPKSLSPSAIREYLILLKRIQFFLYLFETFYESVYLLVSKISCKFPNFMPQFTSQMFNYNPNFRLMLLKWLIKNKIICLIIDMTCLSCVYLLIYVNMCLALLGAKCAGEN